MFRFASEELSRCLISKPYSDFGTLSSSDEVMSAAGLWPGR